jgi:D-arabinose 1-dehydrogenase-like Zn-dependent alcohol dehydrogenase
MLLIVAVAVPPARAQRSNEDAVAAAEDAFGMTVGREAIGLYSAYFYLQGRILGSTGCTRGELAALLRVLEATGVRPVIDRALPLEEIHKGFQLMIDGALIGKLVIHPPAPQQ